MKRNNNYLLILAVLLLIVAVVALWGCETNEAAYTNYTPEDFIALDNFTLKTNVKPDNVIKYVKSENSLMYSSTYVGDAYTNTVYYVFEGDVNKEFSEGSWKEIEDADAAKYVDSIENACGLIYNKLDATEFEEISGKKLQFSINPERFFKQAYRQIYENYFGKDYKEETFQADFEENAPTLFGNMNDYKVTLDCSVSDKIVLSIKNTDSKDSDVYEYYAIGKTEISLPQ